MRGFMVEKLVAMFLATTVSNSSSVATENMDYLKEYGINSMVEVHQLIDQENFNKELCQELIIDEQERLAQAYEEEKRLAYEKQLREEQERLEAEQRAEEERIAEEQRQKEEAERLAYEEYLRQNPEFPKYDLSVDDLTAIAKLCQQEQRTVEGAAAEASLIANRYELYNGKKWGNIRNYAENCGWWAGASSVMRAPGIDPEIYEAVRVVLMEGKRTLPKYVDEHDCISDISYITTGDKWNPSDYQQFETMVYNVYGSSYGFYDFPGTNDAFGWTDNELRASLGEDHYEFENILTR